MSHRHRYRLDEPSGRPTVTGVCACGAEREFVASSYHGGGKDWLKTWRPKSSRAGRLDAQVDYDGRVST